MHLIATPLLLVLAAQAFAGTDPMFAIDGTLVHRVALEGQVSHPCAAALVAIQDEFATRSQLAAIDRQCHEEVEDRIHAGRFSEVSADGLVAIDPIAGVTLFMRVEDGELVVVDAIPGGYAGDGR